MKTEEIFEEISEEVLSMAQSLLEEHIEDDEDGRILYNLGNICSELWDSKTAFEYYTKAAEKGNGRALFKLGVMYENGNGIKEDIQKALEYYNRAADEFLCADAMYHLGYIHYYGIGVEQDRKKGFEFFMRAAEKEHYGALKAIADSYYYGNEVIEKNTELAAKYALDAYNQLNSDADNLSLFNYSDYECDEYNDDEE